MSKILDATANASGVVSVEGFNLPNAQILSEGKQASSGLLFIDEEKLRYLCSSATDIKATLDKISLALAQIASALTTIDAKPTGGTGSAVVPTVTSNVAQINSIKTQVDTLKGALK